MSLPSTDIPPHEFMIQYLCKHLIGNDTVLRKLQNFEDEFLTFDEVCDLLKCKKAGLNKLIDEGDIVMVSIAGKRVMSRKEFRKQSQALEAKLRRGF